MDSSINYIKVIGAIFAIGLVVLLVWLAMQFVVAYPLVGFLLLGLVGLLVVAAFVWAYAFVVERVAAQLARKREHELAIEMKRDELEERRARRELEAYQVKERLRLEAMQQEVFTFGQNQVMALRDGSGLRIEYEPVRPALPQRVKESYQYYDAEYEVLVPEPEIPALPPPPFRVPTASKLLMDGDLDGDDILLGFNGDGAPVRRTWKQIMALLILGLMGGGKTNTAAWIVTQEVRRGARLALIDKHTRSEESMYYKLRPLLIRFDTPVGDSPKAAARVIQHVRNVFYARMDKGAPVAYKLMFCVDEFTAIARAAGDKNSEWQAIAISLLALIEELNTEGRKYGVHAVCVGQAANASRSGGTEVRDLFHTRIVHGMRARQAQLLGLTDEKKDIQKLETGQVYVDIEGKDDPFFLQVPEVDRAFLVAIAQENEPVQREFLGRSAPVQNEFSTRSEQVPEQAVNRVEQPGEQLSEQERRVLELRKTTGKIATIEEVFKVKRGGSAAWQNAVKEYTKIVEKLAGLDLLKVEQ